MSINWFTFAAQIVNFVILVLLLRHFLYGRIINAMDRREQRMKERMDDVSKKEAYAQGQVVEYQKKMQDLEGRRQEILVAVDRDADDRRRSLLEEARKAVEADKARWQSGIERDRDVFIAALRATIGRDVCRAAGQVLRELADTELEERIVAVFIRKLETDVADLAYLKKSNDRLLLRSTFALSDGSRERLIAAVRSHVRDNEAALQFERSPELVCGIELAAAGRKLSWTVRGYLAAIEADILSSLSGETVAAPAAQREETHVTA
jgi:F-type H+-transporting ATPase subunit b